MMLSINKKLFFLLIIFWVSQLGSSQEYFPKSKGKIIKHSYYTLSYLENYGQAEWVYYVLTPEMLEGDINRTNNFRLDPKTALNSGQLFDYNNPNYEKGHLAPAGDMKISSLAMSESFYMSNISPQSPSFNRGIWKSLENRVRVWANRGEIHIVTGSIFTNTLEEVSFKEIDVPKYFYKVIFDPFKNEMIAFVLPNEKGQSPLIDYVVSVDKVEELTSIDFFPQLSDTIENKLESRVTLSNWTFPSNKIFNPLDDSQFAVCVRCKGIAISTMRQCKNMTEYNNGYCYIHQVQSSDYIKRGSIKHIILNYMFPVLIILLVCIIILLSWRRSKQNLGSNYYYLPKEEAMNIGYSADAIIYKSPKQYFFKDIIIYGVVSVNKNRNFVLVSQKTKEPISKTKYYIILKKIDLVYGPYDKEEYLQKRKELNVPKWLVLKK